MESVEAYTYVKPRILGIDPGAHGALAFLHLDGSIAEIEDMPVVSGSIVNGSLLSRLIQGYGPIHTCVLEQVGSRPGQSAPSMWKFAEGFGVIKGVLAALEVPLVQMTPNMWKTRARLGKDKELSRQRALETWPTWADSFKLKKHEGRAEACLLAHTWLQMHPEHIVRRAPRTKKPVRSLRD